MKKYMKRALASGAVLAVLSGVMAAIIVGADFATRDTIARNKKEQEDSGLRKVFGAEATYGEPSVVNGSTYTEKYWEVSLNEEIIGRVYRGSGKNGYGEVTLLYGLYEDYSLGMVVTLANTESYGTTLKEGYLDVLASAEDPDAVLNDVKCGATYGAKLCRDIILEGKAHYKEGGAS